MSATHRAGQHWVDRDVGQRIRNLRLARGMSQAALAAPCGISFQQVQKYERGANRISISMLFEIARTLNVPLAALLPPAQRPRDADFGRIADDTN